MQNISVIRNVVEMKCFKPQHDRYLHPLATTDRPICVSRLGFYLFLIDLEIKRIINKLETCKYTDKLKTERKYQMTKEAFAVLSWSPRSRLIYSRLID